MPMFSDALHHYELIPTPQVSSICSLMGAIWFLTFFAEITANRHSDLNNAGVLVELRNNDCLPCPKSSGCRRGCWARVHQKLYISKHSRISTVSWLSCILVALLTLHDHDTEHADAYRDEYYNLLTPHGRTTSADADSASGLKSTVDDHAVSLVNSPGYSVTRSSVAANFRRGPSREPVGET